MVPGPSEDAPDDIRATVGESFEHKRVAVAKASAAGAGLAILDSGQLSGFSVAFWPGHIGTSFPLSGGLWKGPRRKSYDLRLSLPRADLKRGLDKAARGRPGECLGHGHAAATG